MKLRRICKANFTVGWLIPSPLLAMWTRYNAEYSSLFFGMFALTAGSGVRLLGIFIFTLMPPNPEAKRQALQTTGPLNPRAAQVRHPLFQKSSFFDPEDLLQLKYETLRALEVEHCPIAKAARDFGLSRPTICEAHLQFLQQGLEGLLPHKRGPKAAHKLTEEVLHYLQEQMAAEPELKAEELAGRVRQRYRVKLHPRTIQKALQARAKRGRLV
jgi:transposase